MEGRPLNEVELGLRARRGDGAAYEELVRMHQGIVFRTAYLLAGDAGLAEEAAQDAFVKAHRALGRFRVGAPFRPWLLQIVANETRNLHRSRRRRDGLVLRAAAREDPDPVSPDPADSAVAVDRRHRLIEQLRLLDVRDREVLVCRYLLDLSEAETAAALAIRPGTVKSRLSRALERLRAQLETV